MSYQAAMTRAEKYLGRPIGKTEALPSVVNAILDRAEAASRDVDDLTDEVVRLSQGGA